MKKSFQFRSLDVPQADSLPTIRKIVTAVRAGHSGVSCISKETGVSERHVRYRLQAARVLGLLDEHLTVTARGKSLLDVSADSEDELQILRECVRNSAVLMLFAPDILTQQKLDKVAASKSIQMATGLSQATADRRASVLSSWQRQLVQPKRKEKPLNEASSSVQTEAIP